MPIVIFWELYSNGGSGNITFTKPTLPGSMLVALVSGFTSNKTIGPDFSWSMAYNFPKSNQGVGIAYKISPGGETTFPYTNSSDWGQFAVYEVLNASTIRSYSAGLTMTGANFSTQINDRNGLKLFAIEHDGDGLVTVNGASDVVNAHDILNAGHHTGAFGVLPYEFAATLTGSIVNEGNSIIGYAAIEGRQKAILTSETTSAFLPHRYWRVAMQSIEDKYVYLHQMTFAAKIGGEQIATGGTILASGSYDGNGVPANAFDNNDSTYWESQLAAGQYSKWIGYDFGKPVTVAEVRIAVSDSYAYPNERPNGGWVQFSDDGSVWTNAWGFGMQYSGTGLKVTSIPNNTFTGSGKVSSSIPARYWRIRVAQFQSGRSGWGVCKMAFRDSTGFVISTGGSAISSGPASGTWSNDAAFDGVSTQDHGWYTGDDGSGTRTSDGSWIGYDFGRTVTPASVEFASLTNYTWSMPRAVVIEYSFNGINWFTHSNVSYTTPGTDNLVVSRPISELPRAALLLQKSAFPELATKAGKILAVKSDETGVEWIAPPTGGGGTGTVSTTSIIIALSDEVTPITTGSAKTTIRMPYGFTLTGVRATLTTASTSGLPTVDINCNGVSIFSTLLSIDATEKTSKTATVAAVLSTTVLADDDEIAFDIDVSGTNATGLKVYLIGTPL